MARLIAQALTESNYSVTTAANGREGRAAFNGHDLILADVMMPVENGFEMIRRMRADGVSAPVIFLTARDSTSSQVEGLDLGADDYIVKPFRLAELLARIRATTRRAQRFDDVIHFADLTIDDRRRSVLRAGRPIDLSATEYALLIAFARRPEQVLSKSMLLAEVWQDGGYHDDNLVEVYIRYLRHKLETSNQRRLIHTLRGQGYVLREDAP